PGDQRGILRLQLLQPRPTIATGRFRQPEQPAPAEQRRGETHFAVDRSPLFSAVGADGLMSRPHVGKEPGFVENPILANAKTKYEVRRAKSEKNSKSFRPSLFALRTLNFRSQDRS